MLIKKNKLYKNFPFFYLPNFPPKKTYGPEI